MDSLFVPLFFVVFPVSLASLGAVLARRAERPSRRRAVLLGFAYVLVGVPLAFFALMLVGESVADLGAGPALAMIGPWALAAVGYLALARVRPDVTIWILAVLTALPLALAAWSTVDPVGFGAWLDQVGPLNLVASQFLIAIAVVVAWRRPRGAGVLIVVIAAVPALAPLVTIGEGLGRELVVAALSLPAFLAGVLMILAGTPRFGARRPRASEPRPRDRDADADRAGEGTAPAA